MYELSEEQQIIFQSIKDNKNTVVDACAGTGKTALILSTAKQLPRRKFLQMTYNSALRHEVKERVKQNDLKNLDVHTFHSLAVKYYYPSAYTDTGIRYILHNNMSPTSIIPKINVLVLDEAQDMTFLYYQLMCKFIQDMGSPIQLLILGDYMQGLYEFKGADIRFLTFAQKIWDKHPMLKTNKFDQCTMRMSYRITNQMCSFVNRALLGDNRMDACRDGAKVLYACNSRFNLERIVFGEITKLLEQGSSPGEFFVLGGSVKGVNSNIRQLENALSEKNIPCHVPMLETDKIDERVIGGKVVFSTFHCIKGRQRKYVFVVGFDNSYLRFYSRNLPRDICPNTLYVACTRATDCLYLLESNQYTNDRPLEFLKMTHNEMNDSEFIQFKGTPRTNFFDNIENPELKDVVLEKKHNVTPTDLIKFIPESVIEEISPILDRIFVQLTENNIEIEIPTVFETRRGHFEEVSDLNGIAIPCMYYDHLQRLWSEAEPLGDEKMDTDTELPNVLYTIIENHINNMRPNEHLFLKDIFKTLPKKLQSINEYLYIANVCVAVQETLYFKLKQIDIDEYNWLDENVVEQCKTRLGNTIGIECQSSKPMIEETIIYQSQDEQHIAIDAFLQPHFAPNTKFRFTARIDLITEKTVWELKCTSHISLDHKLQTIIYAWLWKMLYPEDTREIKIFNIKTGEIIRLDATMEELSHIMLLLLKGKFQEPVKKTDEEFIHDCQQIIMRTRT